MAKITKKQLKEDALLSTTAKMSVFLNQYWGHIVGAIVAVAVIVAAIAFYGNYVSSRNEKAARNFNEAKAIFDEAVVAQGTAKEAGTVTSKFEEAKTKFQEVSRKSGHKDTTSKALFYSAKCSYQLGNYSEAITAFQKFADKYPKNIMAPQIQRAVGNCYEQLGGDENLRKAVQQYDKVLKAPETAATLAAVIDKGRCYEKLGQWDQAIAAYESITSRFKKNAELAVQDKCKELVQTAKDVILKYDALTGGQTSADFTKFVGEAKSFATNNQWFEALKSYDKAVAVQKKTWSDATAENYSQASQKAAEALKDYEKLSSDVIKFIVLGRNLEKDNDWEGAVRYYGRASTFDFLPDQDLYEKAQFRIHWINSVERAS